MRAGSEDHAGVQNHRNPVGLRLLRHPLGQHNQALADGNGLVVLLPIVLPVLILHRGGLQLQGAEWQRGVLRAELVQMRAQQRQLLLHAGPVLQIQPDLGESLHLLLQCLVHIIPVLAILLQKLMKLLLIVHNKAVISERRQICGGLLHSRGCGFDGDFQPLHLFRLLLYDMKYSLQESGGNDKKLFFAGRKWKIETIAFGPDVV